MASRILRIGDVLRLTGVCRTTIWRWSRTGKFPAPIRLGSRHIGWRAEEVEEWVDSRETVAV